MISFRKQSTCCIFIQVVCLGGCSTAYSNTNLPSSSFAGPTMFGFWDDLMIYAGTSQTIYYNVIGAAPNRMTIFEFYESHYSLSTAYYHFQIIFYENQPGVVKCIYFEISDGGVSATIGVQSNFNKKLFTSFHHLYSTSRFFKWTCNDLFSKSSQCSFI